MPITLTYDIATTNNNDRTYLRSMLERFHWERLGGSVFRYSGVPAANGQIYEDWLNHVAPALMFFRSYALQRNITFPYLTLEAQSIVHIDHSDPQLLFGEQPHAANAIVLATPTNPQSSEQRIRDFITAAAAAT